MKRHINTFNRLRGNYPTLDKAGEVLSEPPARIEGRDPSEILRGLRNPEKANIALLGDPGSGKTAVVQGFAYDEKSLESYLTLEINPEKIMAQGDDRDTSLLIGFRALVEDAGRYAVENNVIVVLFIDEFHKLTMFSPSLMEALKPILEKSALNNFRIIAATTFEEYNTHIAVNRALDQRFLRLTLPELPKEIVLKILAGRAAQHGVSHLLAPSILEEVYNESKQVLLSNSQPRASIDILLSMIGDTVKSEHMVDGKVVRDFYTPEELGIVSEHSLSRPMLKRVIQRAHSVDIDNNVNIAEVETALRSKLLNQDDAINTSLRYLEMAAVGFNEVDRPKFSFLSTGTTGVGKSCYDDELVPVYSNDGTLYKKHGDLKVGDYVFDRLGKPTKVTGVFPQGELEAFEIEFADGNIVICNDEHLWQYKRRIGNGAKKWKVATLKDIMSRKFVNPRDDGRIEMNFEIPSNHAIERDAYIIENGLTPYVLGAMIGNGALREKPLSFSSNDEETVAKVAEHLGAHSFTQSKSSYTWVFAVDGTTTHGGLARIQTKDVIPEELIGTYSHEKFIPEKFKGGSIEQRWDLIQGLFDTDGSIESTGTRFNVRYSTTSEQLGKDIQEVLCSLGVSSQLTSHARNRRDREECEYSLHVQVQNKDKYKFFSLKRKLDVAKVSTKVVKKREKKFDTLGIRDIRPLNKRLPMTCIMVDNEEHLYQVGKGHIVTHNTELAKIISNTMRIPLKRFDMSRYSDDRDAGTFADDLFMSVWASPNAYILIDEVEKSSKKAMNILLQVLDDARLTDSTNPDRVASFTGSIINLTTNLGSEVLQSMNAHQSATARIDTELIYIALSESDVFETAVLGRIDAIVPFRPLPESTLALIAQKTLDDALLIAETNKRRILVSDDVIPYIVQDRTSQDTERGGARDAKRNIRNLVVQEMAHHIAHAEREVPIVIYIKGKPRFKHAHIADVMNASVALQTCHPMADVENLLKSLSERVKRPLVDKGLFLVDSIPLKDHAVRIAELVREGYNKFTSIVNNETVEIIGVE